MAPGRGARQRRERFQRELDPVFDGLYRTAVRLTRDQTAAEDVVQEAVLKAYRFFDTYKPGTNFRAWVFRVLYTVFINRTRERTPRAVPLEGMPEPAWEPAPLDEELGRSSHLKRVQAVMESVDERIKIAVAELPEELRMVFLLNSVEGLKYREIAEVMQCPLGTVMSRLFRSRRILQEKLAEYARSEGFDVPERSTGRREET